MHAGASLCLQLLLLSLRSPPHTPEQIGAETEETAVQVTVGRRK